MKDFKFIRKLFKHGYNYMCKIGDEVYATRATKKGKGFNSEDLFDVFKLYNSDAYIWPEKILVKLDRGQ